jgi:hypothetical protein
MTLIGDKSVIFSDHFDGLMNPMTMLETEFKITSVSRVALVKCGRMTLRIKRQIFVNLNDIFEANIKTVLHRL